MNTVPGLAAPAWQVAEWLNVAAPLALRAFVHEYRIAFPIGIDQPGPAGEPLPETMRAYAMQGTPTLLLYDRRGGLHGQIFGPIPDLRLGAEIMALLRERADDAT